ncbi:MAG: sarcosine oxidase subunit gamma, partial [Candidatus Puniceispirillaceae bacterium]
MHDLVPLTPLGGDSAKSEIIKGVTISEMPDFAYASMAMRFGRKTGFQRAAKKATGISPPPPGESAVIKAGRGLLTVFWTGVDQWMVEAPHAGHADLAAQLSGTLKDNASVTEQNDGWARFDLQGENCVAVLERLSAADSAS